MIAQPVLYNVTVGSIDSYTRLLVEASVAIPIS
jgi:hypothetical protein